ncbi:Cytochrome P450 3A13 like protein [Argiope bruennichi]|uniref:Cytochrome P450 3A13 like protein n=1 Tax=Argiope bruennichi TaxID=94029 RepID=A0A8T0G2A4_ARGBR|nr:Cytochrome P450 3A13 like protein [Argiope bruennichi]
MDTAKELSEDPNSEFKEKDNEDIAVYGGVSADHQVFKNVSKKHLSVTEVIAQCITFFFAGYESVSTALSMATYMLALHPDVQEKVHADLVKIVEENNMESRDAKYWKIISETLRLFPPILRTERQAVSDYKLGDTGITLPKGTVITVPIYAMHRDPEFFPDPEKFDPDRFSPEERSKRDPYAYLPFGAGPRNCVAMRFALVEIKVCLAYVILHFKIKRCPETKVPMEYFRGVGLCNLKMSLLRWRKRGKPSC